MAFNNSGGYEKYPVNTSSLIFFGENVMMSLKFSDNLCIISFRDAKIDENGKRTFPRPSNGDKELSAVLTRDKVAAFMNRIHNEFIPTFKEYIDSRYHDTSFNKAFSIGVPTNKDLSNVLCLSTGKPESGPYIPEITFCADIDPNTRIPKIVKTVKLTDDVPIIIGYDPHTGNYESTQPEYPQIITFVMALEEFVKSQCKGRVHEFEERYGERNFRTRTVINQIAMKNGIQVDTGTSYQQKAGTQSNAFMSNASTPATPQPLEVKSCDGDLASFMQMTGASDTGPF